MTDSLYGYIQDAFNISADHLRTLNEIYDYMEKDCHSLETAEHDGYLVPVFWHDFLNICAAGSVDLTETELITFCKGAIKKSDYYK